MSYTVAVPGGPKPRPQTVSLARLLSLVAAVLVVVFAWIIIDAIISTEVTVIGGDRTITNADLKRGETVLAVIFGVVFAVFAITQVILAVLLGRGRNPVRVVTWVVDGLAVLCCGCGLLNGIVNPSSMSVTTTAQNTTLRITPKDMSGPVALIVSLSLGFAVLSLLAVIVLLALPASNAFFRKEQEVWLPAPMGGDPTTYGAPGTWPQLPPPPSAPGAPLPPSAPGAPLPPRAPGTPLPPGPAGPAAPSGSEWAPPPTPVPPPGPSTPPATPPSPPPGPPADPTGPPADPNRPE